MSDDPFPSSGPGAGPPALAPGKHRGPRFSWNTAYETTFFTSLCESVHLGLREGNTFKPEAWDRALQALITHHNAYANKGHLINKSDNARKKFRLWRGLREDPEFHYDVMTRTVNASEEAWARHLQAEPLSRSLRGRPFEHEELYEILFPDVIGSGGAPKRLTKQRSRKPNDHHLNPSGPGSGHGPGGHAHSDQDAPNTTIMNLLADPSSYTTNPHSQGHMPPPPPPPPVHSASAPLPSPIPAPVLAPIPTPPTLPSSQPPQPPHSRPTHTTHTTHQQPRNNPSTSALTPPEENPIQNRRRPHMPDSSGSSGSSNAEKRRRTASNSVDHASQAPGIASSSSVSSLSTPDAATALADLMRLIKPKLTWPEQAVEIFFRDFSQEDMDFQLKVAEKALTDENKAMVFCKMPNDVRRHWIKRLREAHNRSI
ncbi:Myb/SANT-like DNA-binding domain-containing protein [Sordaria brevicollis]|uniref:Myb/SANT-like DNA-binding domain-containing protein n=1 Tax=Sordaria brevicollis TaxID=83679 RepID=A0AAE0PH96_SORBR|nr:Myb/SANT-like DNA-binding domain-containing protein [Sordaria brevicollis]